MFPTQKAWNCMPHLSVFGVAAAGLVGDCRTGVFLWCRQSHESGFTVPGKQDFLQ